MNRLFDSAIEGLRSFAALQKQYDADMWEITTPAFANLRHIQLHLSKSVGKIAGMVEPLDHQMYEGEVPNVQLVADELSPVLADLVIHAAQLATMVGGDLGEMIRDRYRSNSTRFAPDSVFSQI